MLFFAILVNIIFKKKGVVPYECIVSGSVFKVKDMTGYKRILIFWEEK